MLYILLPWLYGFFLLWINYVGSENPIAVYMFIFLKIECVIALFINAATIVVQHHSPSAYLCSIYTLFMLSWMGECRSEVYKRMRETCIDGYSKGDVFMWCFISCELFSVIMQYVTHSPNRVWTRRTISTTFYCLLIW